MTRFKNKSGLFLIYSITSNLTLGPYLPNKSDILSSFLLLSFLYPIFDKVSLSIIGKVILLQNPLNLFCGIAIVDLLLPAAGLSIAISITPSDRDWETKLLFQ